MLRALVRWAGPVVDMYFTSFRCNCVTMAVLYCACLCYAGADVWLLRTFAPSHPTFTFPSPSPPPSPPLLSPSRLNAHPPSSTHHPPPVSHTPPQGARENSTVDPRPGVNTDGGASWALYQPGDMRLTVDPRSWSRSGYAMLCVRACVRDHHQTSSQVNTTNSTAVRSSLLHPPPSR